MLRKKALEKLLASQAASHGSDSACFGKGFPAESVEIVYDLQDFSAVASYQNAFAASLL